jgi:hypothetical protein
VRGWQPGIPASNSVVGLRSLNGASPNALAGSDRGEVARQMVTDFQPEGFTDAESGPSQERKEHLIAALRSI